MGEWEREKGNERRRGEGERLTIVGDVDLLVDVHGPSSSTGEGGVSSALHVAPRGVGGEGGDFGSGEISTPTFWRDAKRTSEGESVSRTRGEQEGRERGRRTYLVRTRDQQSCIPVRHIESGRAQGSW